MHAMRVPPCFALLVLILSVVGAQTGKVQEDQLRLFEHTDAIPWMLAENSYQTADKLTAKYVIGLDTDSKRVLCNCMQ